MLTSEYPKVLVVSHNCLSKSGSNGRTLSKFLRDWPKTSVAQFYISGEVPESAVCDKYFRVTDADALKAFFTSTEVGTIMSNPEDIRDIKPVRRKPRNKRSFYYIARNFIWDSQKWYGPRFDEWVDDFNPDVVLLQLGDYAFMLRIALRIAKGRRIPIMVYNTEDYYFKDRKSLSPIYHYYRYDYKREVRRLLSYAKHSIYNTIALQEMYEKEFGHQGTVIMTATGISPVKNKQCNSPLIVSYLGNLGVGRYEPLIEIGQALQSLDTNVYLEVYGEPPNKGIEQELCKCHGIRLKGLISYERVVDILQNSDLLVHAENFRKYYQKDLRNAFSTKIADCLASGTCLFVYAPSEGAAVKYLSHEQAACIVNDRNSLLSALSNILSNEELRHSYINKALELVNRNHDERINAIKFERVISNVARGGRSNFENSTDK